MTFEEARLRAGLTKTELARAMGVKPSTVQYWENYGSTPRIQYLKKLAKILGVKASDIANMHRRADK